KYGVEQLLPRVRAAQPDRDEVGTDENVRYLGEAVEQPRDERIIDAGGRRVPATGAVVNRRCDEAHGAGIGCRLGDDEIVEGALERLSVFDERGCLRARPRRRVIVVQPRKLETER